MKHRFNRAAEAELTAAADWYESQSGGLGSEFAYEVAAGIAVILAAPYRWPEDDGVRRSRIRRFQFGLFNRILGYEVEIVAVADLRRRPGYWRERLK